MKIKKEWMYDTEMKIKKILLDEFTAWVYNDVNQAGDPLMVLDAHDLPKIITSVYTKLTPQHNELLINFLFHLHIKGLINNHDFVYEEEVEKFIKKQS